MADQNHWNGQAPSVGNADEFDRPRRSLPTLAHYAMNVAEFAAVLIVLKQGAEADRDLGLRASVLDCGDEASAESPLWLGEVRGRGVWAAGGLPKRKR